MELSKIKQKFYNREVVEQVHSIQRLILYSLKIILLSFNRIKNIYDLAMYKANSFNTKVNFLGNHLITPLSIVHCIHVKITKYLTTMMMMLCVSFLFSRWTLSPISQLLLVCLCPHYWIPMYLYVVICKCCKLYNIHRTGIPQHCGIIQRPMTFSHCNQSTCAHWISFKKKNFTNWEYNKEHKYFIFLSLNFIGECFIHKISIQ